MHIPTKQSRIARTEGRYACIKDELLRDPPPNALSYAASELYKSERSERTIDRLSASASVRERARKPMIDVMTLGSERQAATFAFTDSSALRRY